MNGGAKLIGDDDNWELAPWRRPRGGAPLIEAGAARLIEEADGA